MGRVKISCGKNINIYSSGNGGNTIIFMAGSGVSSPVLEYRKLYRKFEEKYKIAVIEKLGYGLSDSNTGEPRDIETLVAQSREALALVGIKPSYVLAAHSYSGLEAIYWAASYPDEVRAILGIDMATTDIALAQAEAMPQQKLEQMLEKQRKTFISVKKSSLIKKLFRNKLTNISGAMDDDYLSIAEKAQYERLFYDNLCNAEIRDELLAMPVNARRVSDAGLPQCAGHMFITDMKNPVLKTTTWQKENAAFAKKAGFSYVLTPASHFLYNEITDELASVWLQFLDGAGI